MVWQGTKVNSRGKEMPHGTRLYSIAASRYGDKLDGKTTTLCVRRVRALFRRIPTVQARNVCSRRHNAARGTRHFVPIITVSCVAQESVDGQSESLCRRYYYHRFNETL